MGLSVNPDGSLSCGVGWLGEGVLWLTEPAVHVAFENGRPATFAVWTSRPSPLRMTTSHPATVHATRLHGLTGPISFEVEGLPAGVLAVFLPDPTSEPITRLYLVWAGAVPPGEYPLAIRATHGQMARSTPLRLRVDGPPAH